MTLHAGSGQHLGRVKVFCNGEDVTFGCTIANEDEGWVEILCFQRHANGSASISGGYNGGRWETHKYVRHGTVEIQPQEGFRRITPSERTRRRALHACLQLREARRRGLR